MSINSSNVRFGYITSDQDFYIGTTSSILYVKYFYSTTQCTEDHYNALVKIDNLISSSGNPINIGALNCVGTLNMNGNTITNCPSLGSITGSNSIAVNTGTTNFLTKTNTVKSGTVIYGMTTNSFLFENQNGENAGFGCDGGSDNNTIWSAGDGSSICNFQDEDTSTRLAYVNTSGVLIATSTRTRKHSIKEKNNNNVLDRILKLKIKSYGYKYEFNENDNEKKT
jgi:hypothetical protein